MNSVNLQELTDMPMKIATYQVMSNGAVVRIWQPGHYEQQTTQVWVP